MKDKHTHTHKHPFNGPLSGTTRVRRYQKDKTNLEFNEARGSGISWAVCKSAPCSRQITTPAPHHSVFHRPDALPATQPTVSKQRRRTIHITNTWSKFRSQINLPLEKLPSAENQGQSTTLSSSQSLTLDHFQSLASYGHDLYAVTHVRNQSQRSGGSKVRVETTDRQTEVILISSCLMQSVNMLFRYDQQAIMNIHK